MGYTHYWLNKTELPQDKWDSFIKEVKAVIKVLPKYCTTAGNSEETPENEIHLTGCSWHKSAVFNKNKVYFNGGDGKGRHKATQKVKTQTGFKEDQYWECDVEHGLDHETFSIHRKGNSSFNFCKTARKPYDFAVCVVLTLYAKHFGAEATDVSSDGDWEDWEPAVKLVKDTVGLGEINVLVKEEEYGNRFEFTESKFAELA